LVDDVYLFSKCYDPQALLVADAARAAGASVGVDMFDDYFSQASDSRFSRLRLWRNAMAALSDFALSSTAHMAEVMADVARVHVMNDPGPPVSTDALIDAIKRKRTEALATGRVRVAWFGTGDNPYFPVGLHDVAAFAEQLAPLRCSGLECVLEILTNRRAMTVEALSRLRTLPLPYVIDEWSEEKESALLARAALCFLPVNAQPFSVAKSLNRVVTALSSGTQVLTAGYDLYHPFEPFLYRDAAAAIADLRDGRARVRPETAGRLTARLGEMASADMEGRRLADFLDALRSRRTPAALVREAGPQRIVLHGAGVSTDAHKAARDWNAISVGSPFSTGELHYHIRLFVKPEDGLLRPYVADAARRWLGDLVTAESRPFPGLNSGRYHEVRLQGLERVGATAPNDGSAVVSAYRDVMRASVALLRRIFPGMPCLIAETTRLPVPTSASQSGLPGVPAL
jgi:hypothetical protein